MSTTDTRAAFEKRFGPNDSFAWRNENGNYQVSSLQRAWEVWQASTEAAKAAAQDSAPAELPIKTWQERLREKFPETADRNLFTVGHIEHAMEAEIADLRAALSRPVVAIPEGWKLVPIEPTEAMLLAYELVSKWSDDPELADLEQSFAQESYEAMLAAAPASPQPVAKVLTESAKQNMELVIARLGQIIEAAETADCDLMEELAKEALPCARAILAASTPTKLTEKKE